MTMNEQKARQQLGDAVIDDLLAQHCEPTNRIVANGDTEWVARIETPTGDMAEVYYLTTQKDKEKVVENGGDWGEIDWEDRVVEFNIEKA